jgi:hypothetical protein
MNPAFHSIRAAVGFGLVLTFSLALPVILKSTGLPTRDQTFSTLPTTAGPVSMIKKLIYDDSGRADILFVGSSLIKTDVQAGLLARLVTERIGRPVRVDILELNWYGADQQYFMLKDYLAHHPAPRLVILHVPQIHAYENRPHPQAYRWLRYGDLPSIREGLPFLSTLQMYGEMVLGSPRQTLSLLRPNLLGLEEPVPAAQLATGETVDSTIVAGIAPSAVQAAEPSVQADSSVDAVRSGSANIPQAALLSPTSSVFQVTKPRLLGEYRFEIGPYNLIFLSRMADLVKSAGSALTLIHLPLGQDPVSGTIQELKPWTEIFGPDIQEIAIPKERLFQQLDVAQFYYPGDAHMNPLGGERFTDSIAAPVAEAYVAATSSERTPQSP